MIIDSNLWLLQERIIENGGLERTRTWRCWHLGNEWPKFLGGFEGLRAPQIFLTLGMRAHPELLQYLISLWDINRKIFVIGNQELELETSDIYFIIGLSCKGEPVNLYGSRLIGASISSLVVKHCPGALKSKSGKIDISIVCDLTLRVLLLTINRLAGSQAEHETSKSKFLYAMDCTAPTIFNWAEAIKMNIKR